MKVVMVIDKELPVGLVANTAAVLGISLGRMVDDLLGEDVLDAAGRLHKGITKRVIPVLGGTGALIRELRERLYEAEFADVTTIDFSQVAQQSLDYGHYTALIAGQPGAELSYLGICLCGPDKKVNRLTGSLALLR